VVGGGLAMAGLFFVAHTAIVARGPLEVGPEIAIWWRLIWVPCVGGPYLWYLAMAWYTGAVGAGRHRLLVPLVGGLGALAVLILAVVNPIPSYEQFLAQPSPPIFTLLGIPVALLVYPIYSLLCIVLALLTLRRPAASERFMGDLARRRARPWLAAASVVLLMVIGAVGLAASWFLVGVQSGRLDPFSYRVLVVLHIVDLLVAGLIAIAVVLIGNAIVSYEIFTGRTLPRNGLRRYWRNSLVLAAGYGALVAWSFDLPGDPIYRLMLATVLMTLFYALLSWRSYVERERSMERLRPFVASQHLYHSMVEPASASAGDVDAPFQALCRDVLDARLAYLVPIGPLAPLVGPLSYGTGAQLPPQALGELTTQLRASQQICLPIDAARFGGAVWAVPLWSERGLVGALLLGGKRGSSIYSQEEIEIARAAGERLVDTGASAELARRIVGLQRQRLAESQVVDHRARRVLHDDVLPQLHTAMLLLQSGASGPDGAADVVALLADAHHRIADLLHAMPAAPGGDVARRGLAEALRAMLAGEFGGAFDQVCWCVEPEAEARARALPAIVIEVLFFAAREAVRNSSRYDRGGQASRAVRLTVAIVHESPGEAPGLAVVVEDDGVGLAGAQLPGAGVGRGLALHSTLLAVVGGSLSVESEVGAFTRVRLWLPQDAVLAGTERERRPQPAAPPLLTE
jgi:signal transduction histidine kinase